MSDENLSLVNACCATRPLPTSKSAQIARAGQSVGMAADFDEGELQQVLHAVDRNSIDALASIEAAKQLHLTWRQLFALDSADQRLRDDRRGEDADRGVMRGRLPT